MARVVTKPKGPPYLLIVFIFLFLIATTLAVLGFNQGQEWKRERDDERAQNARIASARNKAEADIAFWISSSKETATVIEKLTDEKKKLVELIVPAGQGGTTVADVEEKVKTTRKFIGSNQPLLNELETFKKMVDERDKQLKVVEGERDEANKKAKDQEETAIKLTATVKEMGDKVTKEKDTLNGQIAKFQKEHDDKVGEIQKGWDSAREELNKNITTLTERSTKLESTLKQKDTKIADQAREILRLTPAKAPPIALMPQADGKVLKVLEGQNLCYINLGSLDRVIPGLTFSVYASGIPESGEGKAQITVTEVNESISLCRIDKQDPGNPIIPNDVVANLVYDPNRAFTFVVEGQFDLFGTGQPTAAGADEIKALVRKYSGRLADGVTAQTDFVVMGAAPPRPPKPADAASEQAKKVYEDQLKEWKHYEDVRNLASQMQVPILNTNRFLALIGYTPTKR